MLPPLCLFGPHDPDPMLNRWRTLIGVAGAILTVASLGLLLLVPGAAGTPL